MGSLVRRMRKRKRCLGEVLVLRREEYEGLDSNARVEAIRRLISLGLMHVQMLLEEDGEALARPPYAHADGESGMRHGSNPGTVVLTDSGCRTWVPRVRSEQAEIPLRNYQVLHGSGEVDGTCGGCSTGSRAKKWIRSSLPSR